MTIGVALINVNISLHAPSGGTVFRIKDHEFFHSVRWVCLGLVGFRLTWPTSVAFSHEGEISYPVVVAGVSTFWSSKRPLWVTGDKACRFFGQREGDEA